MRNAIQNLIILLFIGVVISCTTKPGGGESDEWPEMDSYHMLIAEAFHPYKDSSNLEPSKRLAIELSLEADNWQEATLPDKVNNDAMRGLLDSLKADSHRFAYLVKAGATDQEIGASLTAVHDRFHKVMEAWHGEGEKHEH